MELKRQHKAGEVTTVDQDHLLPGPSSKQNLKKPVVNPDHSQKIIGDVFSELQEIYGGGLWPQTCKVN